MTTTKKKEKENNNNNNAPKIPTQTVRFGLLFEENAEFSYKDLRSSLWSIQRDIREFKNSAASQYFDYMTRREKIKKETGKYPADADLLNGRKIRNHLYHLAADIIPSLQTGNTTAVSESAYSRFSTDYQDVLAGRKSLASFKQDQPINIKKESIKFISTGGKLYMKLSVFSTEGAKKLGLAGGQVTFEVWRKSKSGHAIINRCISGEYSYGSGMLIYNKDKRMWECNLTYTFAPKKNDLNPDTICGIDIGFIHPIYAAVSDSRERFWLPGSEIDKFRRGVEARKRDFSRSRKFAGEGSVGHGYAKRMEPVNDIKRKIANFRETKNHQYSKKFVEFAVKNRCGVIQIRDLSGITDKTKEAFLKNWSYDDLKDKITYKAKAEGITVISDILPHYTSQRCFKCGHISKDNTNKRKFVCLSCGHEEHVDYNAAQNIAIKGIDEIIERDCIAQGIPYPPENKKEKEMEKEEDD